MHVIFLTVHWLFAGLCNSAWFYGPLMCLQTGMAYQACPARTSDTQGLRRRAAVERDLRRDSLTLLPMKGEAAIPS